MISAKNMHFVGAATDGRISVGISPCIMDRSEALNLAAHIIVATHARDDEVRYLVERIIMQEAENE